MNFYSMIHLEQNLSEHRTVLMRKSDYCCFYSDIDECLAGTHSCSDNFQCINVMGDYVCVCKDGYVVSNSGTECEGVFDQSVVCEK